MAASDCSIWGQQTSRRMSAAPSIRKISFSGSLKKTSFLWYIYIYSLFVHPCSQMMTWWNLISHWFSSNDTPSMAHQDPNDLPQENLTDTISLPHGDSLWPHREGQWESKVLETDNNLSNQSEADPWEGPHSEVWWCWEFFLFQNVLYSKSGIAGCLRKDRQSGGEQKLGSSCGSKHVWMVIGWSFTFRRFFFDLHMWTWLNMYLYKHVYTQLHARYMKVLVAFCCYKHLFQCCSFKLPFMFSAHILSQISSGPDLASGAKPMDQWFQWRSDAWLEMGHVPCYIRYTSGSYQRMAWSDLMFLHLCPCISKNAVFAKARLRKWGRGSVGFDIDTKWLGRKEQ